MIMAGNSFCVRNPLVFDRGLQYGAGLNLADGGALHFLPGCLVRRIYVAARGFQLFVALPQFLLRHQDVHLALPQINSNTVTRS